MNQSPRFRILILVCLLFPALAHAQASGDDLLTPPGETPPAAETPPSTEAPAAQTTPGAEPVKPQLDPDGATATAARAQGTALTREGLDLVRRFNQDQVRNATCIVDAAIAFGKARAQLIAAGADPDTIATVQANLYWCKKQMNLEALKEYVAHKGDDFKIASQQMDEVASAKPDPAQAGTYLARANRYADANQGDLLQIAIRFTEVAERFPGCPEGTEANKRAAAAVQAQMRAIQEAEQAAKQTRFTKPKTVVAGATAIPGAQDQKDALAQIRKFYAKSFAKKDSPAKARLARKLIEETAKNRSDPVVFHQLVSEAIRLATEAEAYEPLLDGIELLAGTFSGIDALTEKQAALKKMSGKPVAAAISKLLTEPADPAANLVAGKWFCLVAHRWPEGFAMLALSGDPDLVKIVGMEQAAPTATSEQMQLADAWYETANKQRAKDEKIAMLGRTMYWYQQALAQLTGLAKDRVVKRTTEIEKLLPLDLDNIDWESLTASQWDKLKGKVAVVNARVDRFDPQIALAAGEHFRVVPHPTDQWTIVLDTYTSDGGTKASCDWRGYKRTYTSGGVTFTYSYSGTSFNLGALLVWIENGEKQNAGIIHGPGRVWFAPSISGWYSGDRAGTIRVKLVAVTDEE